MLISALLLSRCSRNSSSDPSVADEKNKAVQQASSLEDKMKALKEENKALKLTAAAERSQKDRLLAVLHTLTGMLDSSRNPVMPPFK